MTSVLTERANRVETVFSRDASIAGAIKRLIFDTEASVDTALYSFSSVELFRALSEAKKRGIQVRLLTDWNKYGQNPSMHKLLMDARLPHRLSRGRNGSNSKMHHKFLILDQSIVLTGSYNWTLASETQNFENIVLIRDPGSIRNYRLEFNRLWEEGGVPPAKWSEQK